MLPPVSELGLEIGTDSNLPYSTPYNPVTTGTAKTSKERLVEQWKDTSEEQGPSVRMLQTMRRMDGQARALYRLMTLPIRSAVNTCTFVPAEDGDEEAEFIESVFTTPPESGGMEITLHRFISQVLQGLFDGFSAFEKVFWSPSEGPLAGKITLKKLAHRPSESVSFVSTDHGDFAGFRQRAYNMGRAIDVFIPKEYAFYYAAQEEERKFYGVSFFQSAFYHYDKKVKMYFIAHLAAQRAAVGTRVGTVPTNATKQAKQEFLSSLGNLSVAQWMAVPDGFKVEILREAGGFSYLEYINHHNSQMSKSVLAGFFDENQGGGPSDASLVNFAQPGDEMFVLMLRAVMDDIANQINHYIIPQLVDLNFKGGKYPKFTWGKLTDEQRAGIASTFNSVLTAKAAQITPEFVRALEEHVADEYGLEIDYEDVEKREEQEFSAAAAQAAAISGAAPTDPNSPPVDPNADPDADPDADPTAPPAVPTDGSTPVPATGTPGAPPTGTPGLPRQGALGNSQGLPGTSPAAVDSLPAPGAPTPRTDAPEPSPLGAEGGEQDGGVVEMPGSPEDWNLDDFESMALDSAAPDSDDPEDDENQNATELTMPGDPDGWGLDDFESMAIDASAPDESDPEADDVSLTDDLDITEQMLDMASDMLALARESI
jgi:hypothetical protein